LVLTATIIFYFYSADFRRTVNQVEVRVTGGENIPVVVVPHFDFAKEERLSLLKDISEKSSPKTLVLVSVNHFNTGSGQIISTNRDWQVAAGEILSAQKLERKLVDDGLAVDDELAFTNEHGITNLLADIYQTFPSVPVLPIIIKDTTNKEKIDQLSDWLGSECKDCLLVSSVDFSHYCPRALANVHDQYSIQALTKLDKEKIWLAETDSPQTLYLSVKISEKQKGKNFQLVYHANSADPSKTDDTETTSVVLGYYTDEELPGLEVTEPSTSFVIAGDAMFDRSVWHYFKDKGLQSIFSNFGERVFRGVNLSLLNLEGPISATEIDDDWQSGSLVFNFPPETTSVLKYLNINSVSLANNHTNNAGNSGFANTKKVLDEAGINYFGKPNGFDESSILRIDGEMPISIIGIMAIDNFDNQPLLAKISAEKSAGRKVIIFPHWGVEYAPKHSISQERLARSWISAGADLIVGSHPHVTQDFEIIEGKPVIYSLGNFVFDQFFSTETHEGLVIAGTITDSKIILSFLPTQEKSVKPEFLRGDKKVEKIKTFFNIDAETGFKKLSSDTIEIDI
jgi:poly-gamma-glutamate synthesis protein (capsule biosynthesis protein)